MRRFKSLTFAAEKLTGETRRDFKPSMLLLLVHTRRLYFTLLAFQVQPAYIFSESQPECLARLIDR